MAFKVGTADVSLSLLEVDTQINHMIGRRPFQYGIRHHTFFLLSNYVLYHTPDKVNHVRRQETVKVGS